MLTQDSFEVIIIGAGVVGNAIARELSRYQLKVAVVEKELDVGMHTSSRNSGVIHSGIHYTTGSLRARLNVQGNSMMEPLCRDLKVKVDYIGKLTVAFEEDEIKTLYALKEQGEANGVPGLEMLGPDSMQKLQPGVGGRLALYSPSTGILCPYTLTVNLAENALANGVKFLLGVEVKDITRAQGGFYVHTGNSTPIFSKVLINAAGLNADTIAKMVGIDEYKIFPCKGEYLILDKRLGHHLKTLVYPAPHKHKGGLGIHLTKTVDDNILIGPSNEYVDETNYYPTTREIMELLWEEGQKLLPGLSTSDIIRSFSGLRPKQTPPEIGGFKDFVIESRKDVPGFINLVGIESPGLTSAPAIALMVKEMVGEFLPLIEKQDFKPQLEKITGRFQDLPLEQRLDLIQRHKEYGEILCRCEGITKKEVIDAINNPLGVRTLSALRYRARVMMGRCQR